MSSKDRIRLFRARPVQLFVTAAILALTVFLGATFWLRTLPFSEENKTSSKVGVSDSDRAAIDAERESAKNDRPNNREEKRPTLSPSLPPLADTDLPLSEQLPSLLLRAEAGDPTAVCRLVINVNRCAEEARSREFTERMMRSLEARQGSNDELMIQTVARSQERRAQANGYCKGVDTASLPRVDSLLKGYSWFSPRQKVVIALMRPDGQLRRLHENSSYSESALYVLPQVLADHSYNFLMEGFQARDPLALEGLVMLHAPGKAISQQGIRVALPNPRLFLKYSWLMERLFGNTSLEGPADRLVQATVSTMTPDALAAIDREVEMEVRRWTFPSSATDRKPAEIDAWDPRRQSANKLTTCDE